jgi:hypothetical protein
MNMLLDCRLNMRKKKLIDKKIKKRVDKKCCFCGEDNMVVLDVHRIEPGSEGGKYVEQNSLLCCVLCHRRIHAEQIKVLGKRLCTNGHFVVHFIENGEEKFKEI